MVERKYPLVYREQTDDGELPIKRTAREEELAAQQYDERRQRLSEQIAARETGAHRCGSACDCGGGLTRAPMSGALQGAMRKHSSAYSDRWRSSSSPAM